MNPTRLLVFALLLVAALAAGCGGVDVDTDAIKKNFATKAEAAYDDVDKSREDDYNNGVQTDCFALDDDARATISDALDLKGELEPSSTYLFGRAAQETLSCPMASVDENDEVRVGVQVGTIDVDAEGLVARRKEGIEKAGAEAETMIDGEADGLDGDDVVGYGDESSTAVAYVHDGLLISVTGDDESLTPDQAYDVLPVVVEEVDRVLGDS